MLCVRVRLGKPYFTYFMYTAYPPPRFPPNIPTPSFTPSLLLTLVDARNPRLFCRASAR